tara:strand:+ start:416 stop:1333 length:918 start_codon:yes stop_codon:yes gene_type:complete
LIDLCGQLDGNLLKIETATNTKILRNGNSIEILGFEKNCHIAIKILNRIYKSLEKGNYFDQGDLEAAIRLPKENYSKGNNFEENLDNDVIIKTQKKNIFPRSLAQKEYLNLLLTKDIVFGQGPAGTGKTYLAIAVGVSCFLSGEIDKIVLTRPAVEAGERLGFLPGDMKEKVDPYMQPLYDALEDCLPSKKINKMIEEKKIEIAPLAFMRGRTLNNSFVVLDEAQNASSLQMKMFLTRLGRNSKMVITGDPSQVDLPKGTKSGLIEAINILSKIDEIKIMNFNSEDIVRHHLVTKIVKAYERNLE